MAKVFGGQTSFLPGCHPTKSVKVLKKTQSADHKPVAWPHLFFIHHQTPDGRDVPAFMPALPQLLAAKPLWSLLLIPESTA